MKRVWGCALALFTAVSLVSCGAGAPQDASRDADERISVIAVNFPAYDFARAVAGDRVRLRMLLPPGSENHSFEPPPRDIIAIRDCDVFIFTGGESDTWVRDMAESTDLTGKRVVEMLACADAVREEIVPGMENPEAGYIVCKDTVSEESVPAAKDPEEDDADAPEYDEHIWTSPKNAALITDAVADALCEADAKNADFYRENAAAYKDKLNRLDETFRDIAEGAARKTLVFADRFPFRYFTDAYGLDYFAAFPGCATETEASAATVAFLIDTVKAERIPVVFFIEFSNEKMADTICEATGAEKRLLHACHNISKSDFDNGETYVSIMERNAENLKEALW